MFFQALRNEPLYSYKIVPFFITMSYSNYKVINPHLICREKDGKLFKVGDYIYLFDKNNKTILANKWSREKFLDPFNCAPSMFYPLGGGREDNESSTECLIREVKEESNGLIDLNQIRFKFWQTITIESQKPYRYDDLMPYLNGKELNLYVAIASQIDIPKFKSFESDGKVWEYSWYSAKDVFKEDKTISFNEFMIAANAML
jgi:NUDIX domain